MMSQTKATKIIKLLLDNEFAPSLLLSISNNDESAFQSALNEAKLTADDLTLSKDEFDSLLKGIKPSGELDLLTWEGYYVVTSPSQGDPLGLLILAGTEKVYWGNQSQMLGNPRTHSVDYRITPDNKLQFSTQVSGSVSILLSREYDEKRGNATAKFSGTVGGKDISGVKAQPPVVCLNLSRVHGAAEAEQPWYQNPITQNFSTIFGLYGGAQALFQTYLWIRDRAWRNQASTELAGEMERQRPSIHEIASQEHPDPLVKFDDHASKFIDQELASKFHEHCRGNPPDYMQNVDQITDSLQQFAETTIKDALRRYIADRVGPVLRESLSKFRAIPGYDTLLNETLDKVVDNSTGEMMERLRPPANEMVEGRHPLQIAIHGLVLEARQKYFNVDYEQKQCFLQDTEKALTEIGKERKDRQGEIEKHHSNITQLEVEVKKNTEKEVDLDQELKRKQALEQEELGAAEIEKKRVQEHEQARRDMEIAKGLKEAAESETKRDYSEWKHEWEKKKKAAFEKK